MSLAARAGDQGLASSDPSKITTAIAGVEQVEVEYGCQDERNTESLLGRSEGRCGFWPCFEKIPEAVVARYPGHAGRKSLEVAFDADKTSVLSAEDTRCY